MTVEIHDTPPRNAPSGDRDPAQELGLHLDLPAPHLPTLEQGGILDAWPRRRTLSYASGTGLTSSTARQPEPATPSAPHVTLISRHLGRTDQARSAP
ncbi:hypothetical protein [Streptomyces sp. NPDC006309]|uniref:hypothetical protein n=1 Tax=Streptomyces sp. NPDC006309 TaxID=3156749 RepID=UPI0033A28689